MKSIRSTGVNSIRTVNAGAMLTDSNGIRARCQVHRSPSVSIELRNGVSSGRSFGSVRAAQIAVGSAATTASASVFAEKVVIGASQTDRVCSMSRAMSLGSVVGP